MTLKLIPAKELVLCDRCGVECKGPNHSHRGALTLRDTAFDYQGSPVASADLTGDLCDPCLSVVRTAIEAVMIGGKTIRELR